MTDIDRNARNFQRAEAIIRRIEGATIGYIGNVYHAPYHDDRDWRIFLAHPDRVGERYDSLGGFPTERRGELLWIAQALEMGFMLGKHGPQGASALRFERSRDL